ncbi:hypothetical protein Y032_0064g3530 [Ancylostoma ceylanicum]|uniref:Uncharacterized protein n=1 Tax=Ancylostoma ceylanicum TaxID=53326 RepID=A0A016U1B2_9BILA|nr:hypothetical protein Y032_0064g3530 [Ancylostoma ceylanicum]
MFDCQWIAMTPSRLCSPSFACLEHIGMYIVAASFSISFLQYIKPHKAPDDDAIDGEKTLNTSLHNRVQAN